jgi:hypothetical protein
MEYCNTRSPTLPCFRLSKKEQLILAIKEYADAMEMKGCPAEMFTDQTKRGRGGYWRFTLSVERQTKKSKKCL